jgi:hypothetical protein
VNAAEALRAKAINTEDAPISNESGRRRRANRLAPVGNAKEACLMRRPERPGSAWKSVKDMVLHDQARDQVSKMTTFFVSHFLATASSTCVEVMHRDGARAQP